MKLFSNRKFNTAIHFIIAALPAFVLCQESASGEYRMLLDEIKIFQKYSEKSINSSLIDSAEYYVGLGEHEVAVVFLEELLDEFSSEIVPLALSMHVIPPKRLNASLRVGVDYNNQEFETKTGYTEENDILIDQVNKPYVGLHLNYIITGDYSKGLALNSLLRYDKENFNGYFNLEQKFLGINTNALINMNFIFDSNSLYPDLSYKDISSRQLIEWMGNRWRFRLDNAIRYKRYQFPVETIPDFIRNTLDGYLSYRSVGGRSINFDITNDYNESIDFENNDYYEQIYNIKFGQWLGLNFINTVGLGIRLNQFNYSLLDSMIHNFSKEFRFAPVLGMFSSPMINMNIEYNYIYKTYKKKSEQEADYHYNYIDFKIMNRFTSNFQLTTGYRFEKKKYIPFHGSNELYIIEQNFYSNGIIAGIDYQNISGWYINASAMYSWRKYPNAPKDDEFSIYYNRNILNLFIMAQIPVTEKLNLSILLSYDNDTDKDYDINNIRSSYFTIELQYSL